MGGIESNVLMNGKARIHTGVLPGRHRKLYGVSCVTTDTVALAPAYFSGEPHETLGASSS